METLTIILQVCGGIAVIGSAGAVIWKFIRPAFKINFRVSELERKSQSDYDLLKRLEESSKIQNRMLLSLLNHMIDGNGIDKMKETRDELQVIITK